MTRLVAKWMPVLLLFACVSSLAGDARLKSVIDGDQRDADNKARDTYRNPYETLRFFGIKEDMTVLEIFPGGGWYTEILGPYLKDKGKLIAATYDRNPETQAKWMARANKRFDDKFLGKEAVYGKIDVVGLKVPEKMDLAPDGSVDMILDFRNAHNWMRWDADAMIKAWHKALKSGGTVGLIDHRMDDDKPYDESNGYIHTKTIIEKMEAHGFKLVDRSEINANAKDTKDHPKGVWTLPPTLALGDEKSDHYKGIGESDRMTLKFVKK